MNLNDWSNREVKRAESTWGQKVPEYSKDMFDFAISRCDSWLDLGCGFGRFLNYLTNSVEDANYIGYDSSQSMIDRIKERFPEYFSRIFLKNITDKIVHVQDSIICSAVMIHIPIEEQDIVLKNVKDANPKKFSFDINCPCDKELGKRTHFYRFIRGAEHKFRMTWQSYESVYNNISKLFPDYQITSKCYDLKSNRYKTIFFLERA